MKKIFLSMAIAAALGGATSLAAADSTSVGNGGNGGAGGSASGGSATGGMATGGVATNSNSTSGVSNSNSSGGAGGSAQGGTATSSSGGGSVGSVSTGGSAASLGDVTVNYNLPASAMGKGGLGVGVDPNTGHVVSDNTVNYTGGYKLKNTPDVNVGGPASGPCNGFSGGLGMSLAGISVGANTSTVDPACTAREIARVAAMIGRMDIANAVLENLEVVQLAMRAKTARDAMAHPATQDSVAPVRPSSAPDDAKARATQEAALQEQQRQAQEALTRNATMVKANDTLKFTDASTQSREKTPQQLMAEEELAKLSAKSARTDKEESPATASAAPQPARIAIGRQGELLPAPSAQRTTAQQDSAQQLTPQPTPQSNLTEPSPASSSSPAAIQTVPVSLALKSTEASPAMLATTTPLPPQQMVNPILSAKSFEDRSSSTNMTAIERTKAVRSALNF